MGLWKTTQNVFGIHFQFMKPGLIPCQSQITALRTINKFPNTYVIWIIVHYTQLPIMVFDHRPTRSILVEFCIYTPIDTPYSLYSNVQNTEQYDLLTRTWTIGPSMCSASTKPQKGTPSSTSVTRCFRSMTSSESFGSVDRLSLIDFTNW